MSERDVDRRLEIGIEACQVVGRLLMSRRGGRINGVESEGEQLKTDIDREAEEIVLGHIRTHFPDEPILSEEAFEAEGTPWTPCMNYWTVDALDGTRSYVEGYDGFCVQMAWIEHGEPTMGVVHEPVRGTTMWALRGRGAYVDCAEGRRPLRIGSAPRLSRAPVFVDSTLPRGPVGALMAQMGGVFLECGSIGLKICRVAQAEADVYAKALTFKLWDVAPGDCIIRESGGTVGLWDGTTLPYASGEVFHNNIIAAEAGEFSSLCDGLTRYSRDAR